eukprot:scaffold98949_cov32-Tisochrysis_lutea.AAC.7
MAYSAYLWPCEVAGERLPQLSRGALQTNIAKARRVEPQQIEPEADTQIGGCGAQNVVSALQGAQDDEQASKAARAASGTGEGGRLAAALGASQGGGGVQELRASGPSRHIRVAGARGAPLTLCALYLWDSTGQLTM